MFRRIVNLARLPLFGSFTIILQLFRPFRIRLSLIVDSARFRLFVLRTKFGLLCNIRRSIRPFSYFS
jgi:hypothetical protein